VHEFRWLLEKGCFDIVQPEINTQGGVCAANNNEEIQVKVSNDFNEQFNIWTSAGYTRRSYISTCFPAQF